MTKEQKERILDLADRFLRKVYQRPLPGEWAEADLTMPQLRVLMTLFLDGAQNCGSLAETVGLSLPTLTGILERLSRRGYLERVHDDNDRRKVISKLSPEGERLVCCLWSAARKDLSKVLDSIPSERLNEIEASFDLVIQALDPAWQGRNAEAVG
ncbi:MAG TPA: MarR family transcriptional regulator [Dehalococcoidia bacterium]|nr:MarR family transcriptional regulator [Dehalococcoidia bacterium]